MSELKRSLEIGDDEQVIVKRPKKIKQRKFALMFCYSGHGYFGLQRNEPFKTIEGEFLRILLKLNLIDQEKYDKPQLMKFQRAARTDKGVSALRQVISCMFPENFPEKVAEVNANLPEEIRLITARRTTPSFDSRNFVDSRTYSYTFPTFTITPHNAILSTYHRIDNQLIDRLNELLSLYQGTHNFYNFTSGKSANDNSAVRYIMQIDCSYPFAYEEMEFAKITIRGQSFMLHQIRKMVGLAFAIMRGFGDVTQIKESFHKNKQDIPIAPSLGLLLENVHYDVYNRKFTGNSTHEPLVWDEFNDQILKFKTNYILPRIYEEEKKHYSMIRWIETLSMHKNLFNKANYDVLAVTVEDCIKDSKIDNSQPALNSADKYEKSDTNRLQTSEIDEQKKIKEEKHEEINSAVDMNGDLNVEVNKGSEELKLTTADQVPITDSAVDKKETPITECESKN